MKLQLLYGGVYYQSYIARFVEEFKKEEFRYYSLNPVISFYVSPDFTQNHLGLVVRHYNTFVHQALATKVQ